MVKGFVSRILPTAWRVSLELSPALWPFRTCRILLKNGSSWILARAELVGRRHTLKRWLGPPFQLVPLTLVQEAQHDIISVILATKDGIKHGMQCSDLIAFLGSGSQTVGSERQAIALEDGGASGIPTEQATDKYKALGACVLEQQRTYRLVLFRAGVCIQLATFRS